MYSGLNFRHSSNGIERKASMGIGTNLNLNVLRAPHNLTIQNKLSTNGLNKSVSKTPDHITEQSNYEK